MYNNFRFLLEKATGEYFMWVSDDDWWAPEFIAEVISMLQTDKTAIAGFTNFMEVDENNNRLTTYPDHLPLLNEFTVADDTTRIKNYINQFEGFGKANLFYCIFRTKNLRTPQVLDILRNCDLPGDMLINLTVLTQGKIAIYPKILKTCTVGNVKSYTETALQPKKINLLIFKVNFNDIKVIYQKWSGFIYYHFIVINRSNLPIDKKLALYPTLIKKLFLFYYDLVCAHIRLRGYDIFSRMQRKHMLN